MTENISKLLNLFEDARTNIGKIDYTNPNHLEAVTGILGALKNAAPEIRALSSISTQLRDMEDGISSILRLNIANSPRVAFSIGITTHNPDSALEASSAALPAPETARSTHTPTEIQNTAGSAAAPGQKPDSAGKPEASPSRLSDLRRVAAVSGKPSPRGGRRSPNAKPGAAPRQEPRATEQT